MSDLRDEEMEALQAIFLPDELTISTAAPYYFTVALLVEPPPEEEDDDGGGIPCIVTISLPRGYPEALPLEICIDCDRIPSKLRSMLTAALHEALPVDGDAKVWEACEWVKENAHLYFATLAPSAAAAAAAAEEPERVRGGFMREWCSFVSLYEQSYCKGDTRFVVMTKLARDRGLNITGIGIAGKPGGLVCEGEESDVVEFMRLMRTEFFETLNPRGRKLTTRLQDRWPLDFENERYEVAEIMLRRDQDVYKTGDRAAGKIKKEKEVARLAAWEAKDSAVVAGWAKRTELTMDLDEANRLVEVGKPMDCTEPNVYDRCGPTADPPTREQIDAQRLFSDFTIFQGAHADAGNITGKQLKSYGDGAKEAGNIFRKLGREDGFDAMFTFRFS